VYLKERREKVKRTLKIAQVVYIILKISREKKGGEYKNI